MRERVPTPPLWLLVMVTITASISVHLFVPAMPAAATELHASPARIQLAITVYLLGLALGQLLVGPLADAWGRRPVLLSGLGLFAAGSLGAALAPDLPTLLAARVAQALGACAGVSLGRVMVRDTSDGTETVRRLALLAMMIMLSPGLAPWLGVALSTAFGWRSVFGALAVVGLAALWIARRSLPETGRLRCPLTWRRLHTDYGELLRSRRFVGLTVGAGAWTTSVFAFVSTAPFILTRQLHLPQAQAGLCAGAVMMGIVAGSALTGLIVARTGSRAVILAGLTASISAAALLLALTLSGHLGLAGVVGPLVVFTVGIGMSSAALMARAISLRPALVASATGLYGAAQMAMGTMTAALAASDSNPALTCARTLFGMTVLAAACILPVLLREGKAPTLRPGPQER